MRLGVYGGTFDPPHLGHLILAAEAFEQLRLQRLLWVLTPESPFKTGVEKAPIPARLQMLQAAIQDYAGYEISDIEIRRPSPQYAVDTVRLLKAENPGDEIIYLVGGDSLHDLPTWHQPQDLVAAADGFGVMRRLHDRVNLERLENCLPGLSAKVEFVHSPLIEISGTEIRRRVQAGRSYRQFVPLAVYELIESLGLYR